MHIFWMTAVVALAFSAVGFKKYVWFISIGYGFSVAAIGVALLIAARDNLSAGIACACALLVAYGCRLGGYLAFRELRSGTYNEKMKGEIKSGDGMSIAAKCGIWVFAALLYAAETSPIAFRIANGVGDGAVLFVGMAISALGLVVETSADLQKNAAKKANPHRFVDTGLFRIVRCPNYFGEMLFWTGVFVGGIPAYAGAIEWIVALLGYLGIIYVMFSGARRLEIRQNKTYGEDPEYQSYVATTPIMIPLVPLYSVEKHKWLVA
jgi:steroid 5-alpha reductase family enzyme